MKTIYFLAVIYFAAALWQAVYDGKGTVTDKIRNYLRAAAFPATWIYEIIKKLVSLAKSK